MGGCPVAVRIPEFLKKVTEGDYEAAYEIIKTTNSLPAVCGRVCPQERQCESRCVRGIKGEPVGIGRLERFVADMHMKNHKEVMPASGSEKEGGSAGASEKANGEAAAKKRVAIIGSGPAGLSCAGDLVKYGYDVTIFEAFHKAGGVLVYGIPEFRLPKAIVEREIDALKEAGVKIYKDTVAGRAVSVDELFEEGFEAVFIGTGAGLPSFMGIPGENGCGVYSANEYLTRVNLMKSYDASYDTPIRASRVTAVVGGGNVAMDAARCALRMGAEKVYVLYRRDESEMPAREEEIHHAKDEGVEFRFLTAPTEIINDDNGNVTAIRCIRMEPGEPDASGRRRPVPVEGSEYTIELDTVIIAVGTTPNPLIRMTTPGLETDAKGCIVTKEDGVTTTREGVFAGGDAVTGAATVILAMGAGKNAAKAIDEYLKSK